MKMQQSVVEMNAVVFPKCVKQLNNEKGHFGKFVPNVDAVLEEIRASARDRNLHRFILAPLEPAQKRALFHLLSATADGELTIQKSEYPLNKCIKIVYEHVTFRR